MDFWNPRLPAAFVRLTNFCLWMEFGMVNRGGIPARVRKGPSLNPSLFHWKCTSETRRDFCFFER